MDNKVARQAMAENGSHGFPRVSCYGHRGEQVDNGRKWPKMAENGSHGFPRVSCYGHRGEQVDNGRKWPKMAEKSSPRLFGRKWIFARFPSFPYYYNIIFLIELHLETSKLHGFSRKKQVFS